MAKAKRPPIVPPLQAPETKRSAAAPCLAPDAHLLGPAVAQAAQAFAQPLALGRFELQLRLVTGAKPGRSPVAAAGSMAAAARLLALAAVPATRAWLPLSLASVALVSASMSSQYPEISAHAAIDALLALDA